MQGYEDICINMSKKNGEIIKNWYHQLNFPNCYDREFNEALMNLEISDEISVDDYNIHEQDGKRNLLSFLFFCEKLKKKYEMRGIPESILYDTLKDIVRWTNIHSNLKGELYLGELQWLKRHLDGILFKLGRLQFCMGRISCDIPAKDIKKSDPILEIHIPAAGPLEKEACEKSLSLARDFFDKYFPEFKYRYFSCHSWLLGSELKEYLPSGSNILQFQEMFDIVVEEESNDILKYVFSWDATRDNLGEKVCTSSLAQRVKADALLGAAFHVGYGFIER